MRSTKVWNRPEHTLDGHGLRKHLPGAVAAILQALALVVTVPYPPCLDHWIVHTVTAVLPLAVVSGRIVVSIRRRQHRSVLPTEHEGN